MNKPVFFEIKRLSKTYGKKSSVFGNNMSNFWAVKDVSFSLMRNETLALVGESGSGKTTLGRCILRLVEPSGGQIIYNHIDLLQLKAKEYRKYRVKFQMIFQNPSQALNPRQTIASVLKEAVNQQNGVSKSEANRRILNLLKMVDLNSDLLSRFPHEISGGQQQRVVLARAIAMNPSLLVADEPTSGLDAVLKKQVIQLLQRLKHKFGLTMLLISHDLAMVANIADRVGIMLNGEIVEMGNKESVLQPPGHPYTQLLYRSSHFNAEQVEEKEMKVRNIKYQTTSTGCSFYDHCPVRMEMCLHQHPFLKQIGREHLIACHFVSGRN